MRDNLRPADPAELKFDVEFALGHDPNRKGHAIIKSMHDLGRDCNLRSAADRVTTQLLRSGYVIYKRRPAPLPASESRPRSARDDL